jgi:hypothetical protein
MIIHFSWSGSIDLRSENVFFLEILGSILSVDTLYINISYVCYIYLYFHLICIEISFICNVCNNFLILFCFIVNFF